MYAYLLDVLARELRDELLKTVTLGVNTDGGEDGLDVLGRGLLVAREFRDELPKTVIPSVDTDGKEDRLDVLGRGLLVAGEVEEEVGCEVLHFEISGCAQIFSQRMFGGLRCGKRWLL